MLGCVEAPCAHTLEAVAFQHADLFGRGQALGAAFVQPVQQQRCFAGRFYGVRQDAHLLEGGRLLGAGRARFPAKSRHIPGKVLGLNAHLVLQRVHQLGLFAALFFQLLCKGFLTLGYHVLAGLHGGFLDVLRAAGLGQIFGHLAGHGAVLADKVCWAAQLVLVGHPEEIQQQQVGLARRKPGAAPHHLAVQAAHLRGPQHHHAVHGRAVPAFGEQHGVAEHIVLVGFEIGQHLLAVVALAVDLGGAEAVRVEQVAELLTGLDEGKEHHRFAVTAALGHFGSDLFEVRVQRGAQLAQRVIAAGKTNVGDIQLQWDGLGHDLAQIALLDGVGQLVLEGQTVEHLAQIAHVAAVGRGGDAQHLGSVKVVEDTAVAVGDGVVGFVNDDGAEIILRETFQPGGALQGLHAAHDYPEPAVQTGGFGFFHGADKAGGALQLVGGLLQQLAPVRQNEHPVPGAHLIGGHRRKHDGLAGAGGQHQQGAGAPCFPLGMDAVTGLLLVRAQGLCLSHLECPLLPALGGCSLGLGRRQEALNLVALAGLTCVRAALLGVLADTQLAHAFGTHYAVPAGTEGLAALALADTLEESAQQALHLGVQVQAVGDGGVALGTAIDAQGQLCHFAGRQLGAALEVGALHAGDLKGILALRQQHKFLLFVGKIVIPVQSEAFVVHFVHK